MGLRTLKKKLMVDQQNLFAGTVVSVSEATASVRLSNGKVRRCSYSGALTVGSQVSVATDGSSYTISGNSTLADLAGEVIVKL